MRRRHVLQFLMAGIAMPWSLSSRATQTLLAARAADDGEKLRLVLELSGRPQYRTFTLQSPDRLIIDIEDAQVAGDLGSLPEAKRLVSAIRSGTLGKSTRVVLDLKQPALMQSFVLEPAEGTNYRLVLDLQSSAPRAVVASTTQAGTMKSKTNRDIVVVIDAGHGGKDPGAVGSKGEKEKAVALAIAKQLAQKLNNQRGFKAHLVRSSDVFIPLRKRVEAARQHNADMFVSVHADAAPRKSASGASVYALSENGATSTSARWMAQRENSSDLLGAKELLSLKNKDPMVANVILDMSLSSTIATSLDLGKTILGNVGRVAGTHQKRVEQAGFAVLKSPDIPSILVETGFISNENDCRQLCDPRHQKRIAQAITDGIRDHFSASPPDGTLLAQQKSVRMA